MPTHSLVNIVGPSFVADTGRREQSAVHRGLGELVSQVDGDLVSDSST
jgi:hypothetical protein